MLKSRYRTIPLLMLSVALTACESKWNVMPAEELIEKSGECMSIDDPSSAMIQVCKNISRECERRRDNGVYIC